MEPNSPPHPGISLLQLPSKPGNQLTWFTCFLSVWNLTLSLFWDFFFLSIPDNFVLRYLQYLVLPILPDFYFSWIFVDDPIISQS